MNSKGFICVKASLTEAYILAPMPAPFAAPIAPSVSYNSTGTLVAFTNAFKKHRLKTY